ncbi:MAG: hypothetical protein WD875_00090 [Pirellulales bacterium]
MDFMHRRQLFIAASQLAATLAVVLSCCGLACAFDEIDDALRANDAEFRDDLASLAAACRRDGLTDAAKRLTAWYIGRDADRFVIFDVADTIETSAAAPPAGDVAPNDWQEKFRSLRSARAAALFELANKAAEAKRRSQAYALLWETLRENPDHAEARRMLGFEQVDDRWATPFAAKHFRTGRVWHKQFGWIAKEDVERYENGERRAGSRWISAEQDARRHRDIRNGWRVETEHFVVTTNHSLAEGVRLADELERLHRAWRQVFVDYWMADGEFERMFASEKKAAASTFVAPPERKNRHRVVCYRNRDEYVRALQSSQPRVEMSLGVYLDNGRAAYFFAGEDQHPATVLHEAAHQLFKESKATVKQPGGRHGMWLVEAAACYMESLRRHENAGFGGYDTLGEREAGRFVAAREKIAEQFYIPLAELAAMSSDDLQRHRDIAKIYSQSAGVMTFLLHAEDGRYRVPTMVTLDALYTGRAVPGTLAAACDAQYEVLDAAYVEFIKAMR